MTTISIKFDSSLGQIQLFRRPADKRPSYTFDASMFQSKSAEEIEQLVGSAVLMLLQQTHGGPVAARDYDEVAEEARGELQSALSSATRSGDPAAELALLQDDVSQALTTGSDCFARVEVALERLVAAGHEDARSYLLDRLPPLKAIWEKRHRRSIGS